MLITLSSQASLGDDIYLNAVIADRLLPLSGRQGVGLVFIPLSPLLARLSLSLSLCKEHVCAPARSGNESCYLDRDIALGVATADPSMIGPRRFDNRRIEVLRFEI